MGPKSIGCVASRDARSARITRRTAPPCYLRHLFGAEGCARRGVRGGKRAGLRKWMGESWLRKSGFERARLQPCHEGRIILSGFSANCLLRQILLAEPERTPRRARQFYVGFTGILSRERRAREFERVNVFGRVGFAFRQSEGSFRRLVLVEIVEDRGVVGAPRSHGVVGEVGKSDGARTKSNGFLEQLAQKGDFRGAGAVQHAAVRPPECVIGIEIRFSMAAVTALRGSLPK